MRYRIAAKPTEKNFAPISLPQPEVDQLRNAVNGYLTALLRVKPEVRIRDFEPRFAHWTNQDGIEGWKGGFDPEKLLYWVNCVATQESRIFDEAVGLHQLVERLFFNDFTHSVERVCDFSLEGPRTAVSRIKRAVENASWYAFLSSLQAESKGLGGDILLTIRQGVHHVGVIDHTGVWSMFPIPFIPTDGNGNQIDLEWQDEPDPMID